MALEEIEANDYNLNVKRYLTIIESGLPDDPQTLEAEVAISEAKVETAKSRLYEAWRACMRLGAP